MQSANNLCQACQHTLPILTHHCEICARFLPFSSPICGTCQTTPPPFDRIFTLSPYVKPITWLITSLKFKHQLASAKTLAARLTAKVKDEWYKQIPLPDLLIPIPLHPKRLQERGFNQALEIAKYINKSLSIPLDAHGLRRTRHTIAQTQLTAHARRQNVANAFSVHKDYTGLTVALLDDVVTTGHTVSACSKLLKAAGADIIHVWCCARRS